MGTRQPGILARAGTAATAAAVSSAVYAGLTSTGDLTASLVGRGIGVTGVLLGSGADYLIGHGIGNGFRLLGFIGENSVRPLLTSSSRTLALGASVVAGTVTQLALPVVLEMPSYLYGTGKYLFQVGRQASHRWLPARYVPTPADSDAVLEAFSSVPQIQRLVQHLPIAAVDGQMATPLQAAETVASRPWQLVEDFAEESSGSDSESETPHPTPLAGAEEPVE